SRALPAMLEAQQLTTKVARVGFDWPHVDDAIGKLDEELDELKRVSSGPAGSHEIEAEVGDLMFTIVNVARLLGVDPETALKASNRKFRRRFGFIEDRLREQGRQPADSDHIEMDA